MKETINNEILTSRNILIENEEMQNGETRFRVKWEDFSGVNITTSSNNAEWQNAHYHKYNKELYVVQKGKIVMVIELEDGSVRYNVLKEGEHILIEPMVKHNVYMCENSMTYVIKFGNVQEKDWNPATELDKISKECNLKTILLK